MFGPVSGAGGMHSWAAEVYATACSAPNQREDHDHEYHDGGSCCSELFNFLFKRLTAGTVGSSKVITSGRWAYHTVHTYTSSYMHRMYFLRSSTGYSCSHLRPVRGRCSSFERSRLPGCRWPSWGLSAIRRTDRAPQSGTAWGRQTRAGKSADLLTPSEPDAGSSAPDGNI